MRKFLFFVVASLALVGQANAQRCLPRMRGIQLTTGMVDGLYNYANQKETGYYFSTTLSTYTIGGNKWLFGGEYLQKYNPYKDTRIPTTQFTTEGGYYIHVLSDANKIFFLYLGGSALAGYETVNWGEKVLLDGSRLTNEDAFIYGGAISLELESYLSDRILLLLHTRERCLWGGSTGHFHTQVGAGIKFIL
ncbi:MAG: conjugal transfer protein TraO [Paludibacter sp.]|nr:conjugal transfer protein TraO [Paludibacter sp.]